MEQLCDFMAGWGAGYMRHNDSGALGLAVGHPMDTVKTIQQMNNKSFSNVKIVAEIMKSQGIIGFYKGMGFPLVSAGILNSVFFGVYGNSLRVLQLSRGNDPKKIIPQGFTIYRDTFIAGCAGGVVQAVMACPSEYIKVRMQTGQEYFSVEEQTFAKSRKPENRATRIIIQEAYRTVGMRGLYTGFVPMLVRDVASSGIYVLVYLYARHHMHGHLELNPGTIETLIAGGLAGTISWIPVVPFDTIKSRMQADDLRNPLYRGTIDCAMKLCKLGGCRILFKGFVMIAIRSFPVNASVFFGYDRIMTCLKYFIAD